MSIGKNIKQLRIEKKFTQKKLSELTDISEVMISQYERGIRIPKNQNLKKLACVLDPIGNRLLGEELPFDIIGSMENFQPPFKTISNVHLELYENKLLGNYRLLNEAGKKEANKRVEELTEILRYTKKEE